MRRLRAVVIIALIWAAAWLPAGVLLLAIGILSSPQPLLLIAAWTIWGALSGAGFAVTLAVLERGQSASGVSKIRCASWGAVGSIVLPFLLLLADLLSGDYPMTWLVWWPALLILLVCALLGAGGAVATVALARRSIVSDRAAA